MDNFEQILNFAIILLLVPTIFFTYRLNASLKVLRENQSSLAKLVQSLNDATFKAENSIPKLKSVTEISSTGLKEVIASAKTLKDDLMFINERANSLADRLEHVIKDGRSLPDAPKNKSAARERETAPINPEDERALAELELLKALRSIK